MKKFALYIFAFLALAVSCEKQPVISTTPDNVLLYIGAGYNSLWNYLEEDIEDMKTSEFLPDASKNAFFVYRHTAIHGSYTARVAPTLTQYFRGRKGGLDSLLIATFPEVIEANPDTTVGIDPGRLREIMALITSKYQAKTYGMIFSSHGTGWLPRGYYANPSVFEGDEPWMGPSSSADGGPSASGPQRTFGEEKLTGKNAKNPYEIDIRDFAATFPFQFDYVLIDACLMGGVEVAWEMRNACKVLGFSQTEIMAQGLPYSTLLGDLLPADGGAPDPLAVCKEYIRMYKSGEQYGGATFSLIDTYELIDLSNVCRKIFNNFRLELARVSPYYVQGFYRYNRHYFYDLKDIIDHIEVDTSRQDELEAVRAEFDKVLEKTVLYCDFTKTFLGFNIRCDCGLSSYLPSDGSAYLDEYYKKLSWNEASGLVK